jgi:small subunit ribosomal protein S1
VVNDQNEVKDLINPSKKEEVKGKIEPDTSQKTSKIKNEIENEDLSLEKKEEKVTEKEEVKVEAEPEIPEEPSQVKDEVVKEEKPVEKKEEIPEKEEIKVEAEPEIPEEPSQVKDEVVKEEEPVEKKEEIPEKEEVKVEAEPEIPEEPSQVKDEVVKEEEPVEKKEEIPEKEEVKVEAEPEIPEEPSQVKDEIVKEEEPVEKKEEIPEKEEVKVEAEPEIPEEPSQVKDEVVKEEEPVEKKEEIPEKEEVKVEAEPEIPEEPSQVKDEVVKEEEPVEKKEEVPEKKEEEQPAKKGTDSEDMMTLLDEHFSKFDKGKIVEGVVVSVDERSLLVDIGFKSESAIQIREFSNSSIPEVGSKIKVYIDSVEDGSGRLKLSKKKADFYLNLEKLTEMKENNKTIEGILRRRVKGGMIVEIGNLEAFLPGSQISTKPIPNLDQFIGKDSQFKILKIDKERRNIIVSRKKVLLEEQEARLNELKQIIVKDAELDGEVRNITDYGAFIDLGGIDGLLHITDMSWGHIKHPSDMLNIGDKVKVKVLNYDEESKKVSLGLKQLVPHPWENIEVKYPEGTIITGKVVNITNYGVFVELESGVEGLVHISEMSWTKKIKHPKQLLKVGDTIKAIVLSTSKEDCRISLGIKQMEPNPWLTIAERYPIDTLVKGKIKSITPFGVFVEIEEDIEGLIHISDISWTKRIYHPKEVFNKGQEIEVKVLSIDKTLHRIALGLKQLTADPWDNLDEKLPINTEITAKIVKIISKGILVDVNVDDYSVEGFVPLSHLAIPGLRKAGMAFELGEELPLKIIELDLENRRLILSVKAYFFAKEGEKLKNFVETHEKKITEKAEKRKAIKEILPDEEVGKKESIESGKVEKTPEPSKKEDEKKEVKAETKPEIPEEPLPVKDEVVKEEEPVEKKEEVPEKEEVTVEAEPEIPEEPLPVKDEVVKEEEPVEKKEEVPEKEEVKVEAEPEIPEEPLPIKDKVVKEEEPAEKKEEIPEKEEVKVEAEPEIPEEPSQVKDEILKEEEPAEKKEEIPEKEKVKVEAEPEISEEPLPVKDEVVKEEEPVKKKKEKEPKTDIPETDKKGD